MITTMNVHTAILSKILRTAQSNNKTHSEIILLLLGKVKIDMPVPFVFGKMVKYQERRKCNDWHTLHLELRDEEYEYLLDLRRLLKMSVSLILAVAVDKYLHNIDNIINSDKYLMRNYVLILEVINEIEHWRHIWGYPHNIGSFIPSQ